MDGAGEHRAKVLQFWSTYRDAIAGKEVNDLFSKKWLKISEASEYTSMSVGFLRKQVRSGTIPFTRVGNKALRFDREALDGWLASQGSTDGSAHHKSESR
jgi:excisionase family DNA binding protein